MNLIDEFMARYSREFDYYQQLARMCQQQCEIHLEQSGVRAMVTARAKHHGRLRAKLIKRNNEFIYENLDKVYDDIVDLAGVRIALYFPGDSGEVDKVIHELFDVTGTKVFPEQGEHGTEPEPAARFSGYHAKHYRVRLKEENLIGADKRYAQGMIEIQVASVLMHAWSEVNHDLVYKPLAGNLSHVELNMLDNLNGLVIAGEVSLETLQQALKERVSKGNKPFSNHFELAAFLYDRARKVSRDQAVEPLVGRVDILYYFWIKLI
jgi:ppGpp synthetase/RelA/SpoT-type nucleotidyltranferase